MVGVTIFVDAFTQGQWAFALRALEFRDILWLLLTGDSGLAVVVGEKNGFVIRESSAFQSYQRGSLLYRCPHFPSVWP